MGVMNTMDFCTTSLLRPDIMERTYSSFQKKLVGIDLKDCRLFLNIDCIPNELSLWAWGEGASWPHVPEDNIEVAHRFFGSVVTRIEKKDPSLHAAINWLWSQVESEYVFFLEDDWEFYRPVHIEKMLKKFQKKSLQQVRIRWEPDKHFKTRHLTYGLSPSMVRNKFCKYYVKRLKLERHCNPERFLNLPLPSKQKVTLYPSSGQTVGDIGSGWKVYNKLWMRVSVTTGEWIRKSTYTPKCKRQWSKLCKQKIRHAPDVIFKDNT